MKKALKTIWKERDLKSDVYFLNINAVLVPLTIAAYLIRMAII